MTDRELIRLECAKLVFRHDRPPAQVVDAAKELESYITESPEEKNEKAVNKGGRPRKSDNSEIS